MEAADNSYTVTLDARNIPLVVKYVEAPADQQFRFRFCKQLPFVPDCHHLAIEAQCDGIRTPMGHLVTESEFIVKYETVHDCVVDRDDVNNSHFDYDDIPNPRALLHYDHAAVRQADPRPPLSSPTMSSNSVTLISFSPFSAGSQEQLTGEVFEPRVLNY
ncbi:hypothetical protein PG988_010375 [Apiospora saccharicola]